MPQLTAQLAQFIADLTLDRVPEPIQHAARRSALDTLGCIIAGAQSEIGPLALSASKMLGEGAEGSVAGGGKQFTAAGASYGNGRLALCLDFDSGWPGGPVPGSLFPSSVFPAALAICEQRGLTSEDLILALICGYEVGGRICDIGTQMEIDDAGRITSMPEVHGISLPATVGASAAAGRLLNQDSAALEQTFGIAASNTATPIGPITSRGVDTPNTKTLDTGWAAMAGSFAAASVGLGSTGLSSIFDGTPSIFTMSGSRRIDPDGLVGDMGSRWALENMVYKPWPTCGWNRHALTALKQLRAADRFELSDIEEIIVGINKELFGPRFFNPEPTTFAARQLSIPYSIALFLLDVPPGPAWASDRWASDPTARELRSKVQIVDYPRAATLAQHFVRGQFRKMPCFVEVKFKERTVRAEVEHGWGDPWLDETRMGDAELIEKFQTATNLPTPIADAVIETLMVAEPGASLKPVFDALAVRWSESTNPEQEKRPIGTYEPLTSQLSRSAT